MNPTETHAWRKLREHKFRLSDIHMRELFSQDPDRFKRFIIDWNGDLLFDYSKHRIDPKSLSGLIDLAHEMGLEERRAALFAGDRINATENRTVMHMALRSTRTNYQVDGDSVMNDVRRVRDEFLSFADRVRNGEWLGYTSKRITDVVNIGIGGSDLDPRMVTRALKDLQPDHLNVHYVANVDGADITEVIGGLRPDTTLFLIAGKTFTTQETMTNAHTARRWFLNSAKESDIPKHFAALSTNAAGVVDFGIAEENMFPFWEWVGRRYSLWSSIGLSTAIAIGSENFKQLLSGAEAADEHFRDTPFEKNIPVLMALLGVWYQNFWGARTQAIIAYDQRFEKLAPYLQQADMESNGKRVNKAGEVVDYRTGAVIWGEPGTNGQHAFFQLIHQGTRLIFCDFIAAGKPGHKEKDHHRKLWANFLAQTEAMMKGKNEEEVREELTAAGLTGQELEDLVPFNIFPGNIPTSSIVLKELTPFHLGALVAFYEHNIFTQGVIWNIHSYDQWDVELGKQLAKNILPELEDPAVVKKHYASTRGLIEFAHKTWPDLST